MALRHKIDDCQAERCKNRNRDDKEKIQGPDPLQADVNMSTMASATVNSCLDSYVNSISVDHIGHCLPVSNTFYGREGTNSTDQDRASSTRTAFLHCHVLKTALERPLMPENKKSKLHLLRQMKTTRNPLGWAMCDECCI